MWIKEKVMNRAGQLVNQFVWHGTADESETTIAAVPVTIAAVPAKMVKKGKK